MPLHHIYVSQFYMCAPTGREGGREEYLDKFLGQARCSMQHQKYTFLRTQGMQILRMEALRISKAEIVEFAN